MLRLDAMQYDVDSDFMSQRSNDILKQTRLSGIKCVFSIDMGSYFQPLRYAKMQPKSHACTWPAHIKLSVNQLQIQCQCLCWRDAAHKAHSGCSKTNLSPTATIPILFSSMTISSDSIISSDSTRNLGVLFDNMSLAPLPPFMWRHDVRRQTISCSVLVISKNISWGHGRPHLFSHVAKVGLLQ